MNCCVVLQLLHSSRIVDCPCMRCYAQFLTQKRCYYYQLTPPLLRGIVCCNAVRQSPSFSYTFARAQMTVFTFSTLFASGCRVTAALLLLLLLLVSVLEAVVSRSSGSLAHATPCVAARCRDRPLFIVLHRDKQALHVSF
jgi:hypothetical protein